MKNKTQEQQGERPYRRICDQVETLSSEVYQHKGVKGFEDYLATLLDLRREYVANFHDMTNDQRQNGSLLLEMVKEQIHESLDVFRARAMINASRRIK